MLKAWIRVEDTFSPLHCCKQGPKLTSPKPRHLAYCKLPHILESQRFALCVTFGVVPGGRETSTVTWHDESESTFPKRVSSTNSQQ